MSTEVPIRVRLPAAARPGESFAIRVMATHPMESGLRRDGTGQRIPRAILNRFACSFEGEPVLDVAIEPAMSANPFLEFAATIDRAGEFLFVWTADDGNEYSHRQAIALA